MIKQEKYLIGQGGQYKVYKIYDSDQNKFLAIKECNILMKQNYGRLIREVEILQHFDCDFIIKVVQTEVSPQSFKLFMDYTKYGSLEQIHKIFIPKNNKTQIPNDVLFTWLFQMLIALHTIHSQGFIHGDIKPENILVFEKRGKFKNPILVLTDFGVSFHKNEQYNQQGTKSFLSPQILSGGTFTEKCDIYSLGIVFFWLISKKMPFNYKNEEDLLLKMKKGAFQNLKFLSPECDDQLAQIVQQMLSYDEISRPSAIQLLQVKVFIKHLQKYGYTKLLLENSSRTMISSYTHSSYEKL